MVVNWSVFVSHYPRGTGGQPQKFCECSFLAWVAQPKSYRHVGVDNLSSSIVNLIFNGLLFGFAILWHVFSHEDSSHFYSCSQSLHGLHGGLVEWHPVWPNYMFTIIRVQCDVHEVAAAHYTK